MLNFLSKKRGGEVAPTNYGELLTSQDEYYNDLDITKGREVWKEFINKPPLDESIADNVMQIIENPVFIDTLSNNKLNEFLIKIDNNKYYFKSKADWEKIIDWALALKKKK